MYLFSIVISLFSLVRFSNSPCTTSTGYNGTCFTSAECSTKGGTGYGSCASGFGVCCVSKLLHKRCIFIIKSFDRTSVASHSCHPDLRFDDEFERHLLAKSQLHEWLHFGRSVFTVRPEVRLVHLPTEVSIQEDMMKSLRINKWELFYFVFRLDFYAFTISGPDSTSQCLTDIFIVSGQSNPVPTICGVNTNQHSKMNHAT